MAVSATATVVSYTGNGSTTSLAVTFPFQGTGSSAELEVVQRTIATGAEAVLSYTTHYTVTGGSGSTGTVVMASAPADTVQIHIRRTTTRTQTVDYTANDPFPADTHELALDRLAMGMHEIQEELDRSFKVSRTNAITTPEFVDNASTRASKLLGFSSDGNTLEATTGRVNSVSVSNVAVSGAGASQAATVSFTDSTGALALGIPVGSTGATGATGAAGVFSSIASQAEAEAGSDNTKGMSALRVKQAVDSYGVITSTDVATSGANKILKLDGSGDLPALSGANLTSLPVTDVSGDLRNIALGSAADRITLLNGIVDPLTDETDVNTSSSSNETFTSGSGGYYRGSSALGAAIAQGAGTAIGNATANGGLAAAFDGTTSQAASASSKYAASVPTDPLLIGKNHGSGVTKTIAGITVVGSSDQGFQQSVSGSITIKLQGSTDNFSSSVVDLGTETFTDSAGKTLEKTSGFSATAFQYHRIHVTAGSGSGSQSFYVAECTFFEETAANMTLISNPFTATSAPSKTILGLQTVENETITINTDLKGFVSRDGGSNFTEVTLALKTTLGQTGTKYYECAETTLTSTSGSSMVWKITTHNTKDVEVHGVALSWS